MNSNMTYATMAVLAAFVAVVYLLKRSGGQIPIPGLGKVVVPAIVQAEVDMLASAAQARLVAALEAKVSEYEQVFARHGIPIPAAPVQTPPAPPVVPAAYVQATYVPPGVAIAPAPYVSTSIQSSPQSEWSPSPPK